jgi:peptide/nickel transport system permease protein
MTSDAQAIEAWADRPTSRSAVIYFLRSLRHHPLGMFGLVGVVLLLVTAAFAPWIAPYSASSQDFPLLDSPSWAHPFGTDRLGRDILSRVIHAARVELTVSLTSVFVGVAVATVMGLVSAYLGGTVDTVIQRVNDAWLAFPGLILLLIIAAVLGPSPGTLIIALVIGAIPGNQRIIRGAVLSEKNNVYVEAARVIGCSELRIMFRHVLPQIVALIIVIISIAIPIIALLGAALSFLGLGLPPPTPSWGGDLSGDAREYFQHAPWMAIFPGAAISLTVLSFNLLGDAMRDIFDPRLQGTR